MGCDPGDREPLRNSIDPTVGQFACEFAFNDRWEELIKAVLANDLECDLGLVGRQRPLDGLRRELKPLLISKTLDQIGAKQGVKLRCLGRFVPSHQTARTQICNGVRRGILIQRFQESGKGPG